MRIAGLRLAEKRIELSWGENAAVRRDRVSSEAVGAALERTSANDVQQKPEDEPLSSSLDLLRDLPEGVPALRGKVLPEPVVDGEIELGAPDPLLELLWRFRRKVGMESNDATVVLRVGEPGAVL